MFLLGLLFVFQSSQLLSIEIKEELTRPSVINLIQRGFSIYFL